VGISVKGGAVVGGGSSSQVRPEDKMAADLQNGNIISPSGRTCEFNELRLEALCTCPSLGPGENAISKGVFWGSSGWS
jgi:hypothetical protein